MQDNDPESSSSSCLELEESVQEENHLDNDDEDSDKAERLENSFDNEGSDDEK